MTTRDRAEQADLSMVNLSEMLELALVERYGVMIGGKQLTHALGYPTQAAFRQALARETVPIHVFALENRKGKFALAHDVARWIAANATVRPPEKILKETAMGP